MCLIVERNKKYEHLLFYMSMVYFFGVMIMEFKVLFDNTLSNIVNAVSGVAQGETNRENVPKIITEGMAPVARQAAAEGAVLLENDGVLPFKKGTKLALFGRNCYDYFYVGYGSGGDVNRPYEVSLADGIDNCESLELDFVLETVNILIESHGATLDDETLIHSDQGCHYTSKKFREIVKDYHLR